MRHRGDGQAFDPAACSREGNGDILHPELEEFIMSAKHGLMQNEYERCGAYSSRTGGIANII
jgi:hypothetical protein